MNRKNATLSVIMVVHDDGDIIARNLPAFLTQQCDVPYEVIVIDDASTDNTPDVLTSLKEQYPNLYTTFTPKSPNIFRKRMALSIGLKAAHHDWIVLADIKRPPLTETMLQTLSEVIGNTYDNIIMLYHGKKAESPLRCQTWEQLADASALLRKAGRRTGRGHRGGWQMARRGVYDVVAMPRDTAQSALQYYDHDIHGRHLWGLRLRVLLKTLFNPGKSVAKLLG